jgi:hypothetical protein
MPDFPADRVPPIAEFNPSVHIAMTRILAEHDTVEANLDTLHDLDAVTPLRNYDEEYARLTGKLSTYDRSLYAIYARYLDRPSAPYDLPAEPSANMAVAVHDPAGESICPYQHMSTITLPPPTIPQMPVITLDEDTARALFARTETTGQEITALADSGATHILIQSFSKW